MVACDDNVRQVGRILFVRQNIAIYVLKMENDLEEDHSPNGWMG
ncbi:unnamed protein product [Larinioides sclopetarius]|uniref:LSM domain-containing protein n=1 Tax=Larinioides sclopetarius TaxID=280406 RepID=A0AAV1Z2E4_9ARAC